MANDLYPHLTVNMSDGTSHEVQIENPDMCRLELVGSKNGFTLEDQKITSLTYMAFANLKRHKLYEGNWENFRENDCIGFDINDDEDDTDDEGTIDNPKG